MKTFPSFVLLLIGLCTACSSSSPLSDAESFVRVSSKSPFYLELSNGSPYIPVGPNICFPRLIKEEKQALENLEFMFDQLSRNGANYTRIYLGHPFYEVEHDSVGVYDETIARRIDKVLALAAKYRIRIKFCFEQFRSLSLPYMKFPTSAPFDKPIYHVSKGGPFDTANDYYSTEQGKQIYLNRVKFFADRYKDNPWIYGWDLWNELNAVDMENKETALMNWGQSIQPRVKAMLPHHLVMQNWGSMDSEQNVDKYRQWLAMEENDLLQIHRYIDLGAQLEVCHGPMDLLAADAVTTARNFGIKKPIILAEVGAVEANHAGPFALYPRDTLGILLHDMLFAPFFAGSAGSGQSWHWHYYIENNNLWFQFGRFTEAIRGINPVEENFVPGLTTDQHLRIYRLKGEKTTLLWCRDTASNWSTELRDSIPAPEYHNLSISLSHILPTSFTTVCDIYDPWTNQHSTAQIKDGKLTIERFKRSIILRVKN